MVFVTIVMMMMMMMSTSKILQPISVILDLCFVFVQLTHNLLLHTLRQKLYNFLFNFFQQTLLISNLDCSLGCSLLDYNLLHIHHILNKIVVTIFLLKYLSIHSKYLDCSLLDYILHFHSLHILNKIVKSLFP
jgi:hypothetical protein